MYSGKSSELLVRTDVWKQIPSKRVVMVKWADDIRFSTDRMSTHRDSHGNQRTSEALAVSNLESIRQELFAADVIGIDEAQFFTGLAKIVIELILAGKRVYLAMLNSTYKMKPWPNSPREALAAYSKTTTLTAVCRSCWATDATCSIKLLETGDLIECGGSDKYQSACIRCAIEHRRVCKLNKIRDLSATIDK